MKCCILWYGIISSYTLLSKSSALESNALDLTEASNEEINAEIILPIDKESKEANSVSESSNPSKKNELLTQLIKKICNIAKGSLITATDEKKAELINEIEKKLLNSTKIQENDRSKYVKLIMEGVRLIFKNSDTSLCQKTDSQSIWEYFSLKTRRSDKDKNKDISKSELRKKELAKQVEMKMEYLVNKTLGDVTTEEEKTRMLGKLKDKVIHAFENKTALREFVVTSLDLALRKANTKDKKSVRRRLNVTLNTNQQLILENGESAKETTESIVMFTTRRSCNDIKGDACNRLKRLNEFICEYDERVLPLTLVCDGSIDCADGSDEKNCENQAAQRIKSSSNFIEYLKNNDECFEEIHANPVLSQQGLLLNSVLTTQLDFIQKYTINNKDMNFRASKKFKASAEEIAKELLLIAKTFNLALTGALCMDAFIEADEQIKGTGRKPDWDLKKNVKQIKISPKSCSCNGKLCISKNCTDICKRVCYQKDSLGRFACKAKEGSVPLSEVCDGKFDCIDETDEFGCVLETRFQAGNLYSGLLELIEAKIVSREFEPVWNHLKSINNLIRQIQQLSMSPKVDVFTLRLVRNGCFDMLVTAFIDMLDSSRNVDEGEDAYEFFLSVNEKLINALKHSHTGNHRVISASDCFCRGLQCALTDCPRRCTVVCAVKPALTTYACGNVTVRNGSNYVNIYKICDGERDCPNGKDESDCKTNEICRSYHLAILRQQVQKFDDDGREFVKDWKDKVVTNLLIAEKSERPTANTIKAMLKTILDDMVTDYGTMFDERKLAKPESLQKVTTKLEKLSQEMIETVKLCGK